HRPNRATRRRPFRRTESGLLSCGTEKSCSRSISSQNVSKCLPRAEYRERPLFKLDQSPGHRTANGCHMSAHPAECSGISLSFLPPEERAGRSVFWQTTPTTLCHGVLTELSSFSTPVSAPSRIPSPELIWSPGFRPFVRTSFGICSAKNHHGQRLRHPNQNQSPLLESPQSPLPSKSSLRGNRLKSASRTYAAD